MSLASLGSSAVIYATVAMAGFFTYGDAVHSNILVSYPSTLCGIDLHCHIIVLYFHCAEKFAGNDLLSVARVCVSLLSAFSYPIVAHPGRNSVLGDFQLYFLGGVGVSITCL